MRAGVEVGKRSIVGLDLRMNELTGAFALARLEKWIKSLNASRKEE